MTDDIYTRLGQHLLHLEAQLRSNDAHSCRHCHYYACDGGVGRRLENSAGKTFIKCRCYCGTVRDTIEAEIDNLKSIILPLAEGEVDAINHTANDIGPPVELDTLRPMQSEGSSTVSNEG